MEAFVGEWTLLENENLEEFLKATGINFVKRKMAVAITSMVSGSQTITPMGDNKYKIVIVNGPRTKETTWTLDVEFEEEAPEVGIRVKGVVTIRDGKMVAIMKTPKGNTFTVSREVVGDVLTQTMDWDGTTAKRTKK